MQVGFQTLSTLPSAIDHKNLDHKNLGHKGISQSPLTRSRLSNAQSVTPTTKVVGANRSAFPESPLISTRPIRYNIQLNQQLTSVQQADSYLSQVEKRLLQLAHSMTGGSREKSAPGIKQQLEGLNTLLSKRDKLSAGTVDRQLNSVLEGQPQVTFSLRGIESLLQHQESETLIFSLAGKQREIAALQLSEESSTDEALRDLNRALGKFKIKGKMGDNQQVSFFVAESNWPRVRDHLSVRGEGHRYPEGQFFPIKLIAEKNIEDTLTEILNAPGTAKQRIGELQQALEQVSLQRRTLMRQKGNVQDRIESMATLSGKGVALQQSMLFKDKLTASSGDYKTVAQAISGQANVNIRTVRNLLA